MHDIETPLSFEDIAGTILDSYHTKSDALGPSKISTYLQCPRQYQYKYIDRIPAPSSPAAALGSTFHAIVSKARAEHWTPDCAGQAAEALTELWDIVRPETSDPDDPNAAAAFLDARDKWLAWYLEWSEPQDDIWVEQFFDLEVMGIELQGTVDRVYTQDGRTVISDVKTGKRTPSDSDLGTDLQLSLYSYAYRLLTESTEDALEICHVRTQKTPQTHRTDKYLEAVIADVVVPVAVAIEQGIFPCNPATKFGCGYCDYQQGCPVGRGVE